MPIRLTFVLVHGSWHDGDCWSQVRAHLTAAGYRSIAPTLPGHAAGDDRASVTHDDYVAAAGAALDAVDGPVVLIGHSFGGSVISRVAVLRPERCAGLVYHSAFVPRDGERVADSLPTAMIEVLDAAAAASGTGRSRCPTRYSATRSPTPPTGEQPPACMPAWSRAARPDLRAARAANCRPGRDPDHRCRLPRRSRTCTWQLSSRPVRTASVRRADRDRRRP